MFEVFYFIAGFIVSVWFAFWGWWFLLLLFWFGCLVCVRFFFFFGCCLEFCSFVRMRLFGGVVCFWFCLFS